MSTNLYTPIIIPITVTSGGVFVDFTAIAQMGAVSIGLVGTGNVFCSFDAMPPSAALANGVFELNPNLPILNLANISFGKIGMIVSGASVVVQVIGLVRSNDDSGFGG